MGGGQSKAKAQSLEDEVARLKLELSEANARTPRESTDQAETNGAAASTATRLAGAKEEVGRAGSTEDLVRQVCMLLLPSILSAAIQECRTFLADDVHGVHPLADHPGELREEPEE